MWVHEYVVRGLDSGRFSSKCHLWLFLCGDILGDFTFYIGCSVFLEFSARYKLLLCNKLKQHNIYKVRVNFFPSP